MNSLLQYFIANAVLVAESMRHNAFKFGESIRLSTFQRTTKCFNNDRSGLLTELFLMSLNPECSFFFHPILKHNLKTGNSKFLAISSRWEEIVNDRLFCSSLLDCQSKCLSGQQCHDERGRRKKSKEKLVSTMFPYEEIKSINFDILLSVCRLKSAKPMQKRGE